jgi:hypothetical protein
MGQLDRVYIECDEIDDRFIISVYIGERLAQVLEDHDASGFMASEDLHLRTEYLKDQWECLTASEAAEIIWPKSKRPTGAGQ